MSQRSMRGVLVSIAFAAALAGCSSPETTETTPADALGDQSADGTSGAETDPAEAGSGYTGDVDLVGAWQVTDAPDDIRPINADGSCSGWIEIDTGGPMTCSISSEADSAGEYTLRAEQTGNRRIYHLKPISADEIAVRGSSGSFTIERY